MSLIESLVTLLVMTLGLFSAGMMTTRSVVVADHALMRSQAVHLAQDLLDRARANRFALSAYASDFDERPVVTERCSSGICDAVALAHADVADWKERVASALPQGRGRIELDAGELGVTVRWTTRGSTVDYALEASP